MMQAEAIKTEIYHENKFIRISYNHNNKAIIAEWKQYAPSSEYREILSKQLEATKKYRSDRVIYDLRKMGVIKLEDQIYTNEVYFTQMSKAGSKYSAIILPEAIFGEVTAQAIVDKKNKTNDSLFVEKYFHNMSEAHKWISAQ